jgi:hypothetical protein
MLELVFQIAMALGVISVGLLAGYAALSFGWTDLKAWSGYFASRDWLPAVGHITHSAIKAYRSGRATLYEPEVRYTYTVEGQSHTGGRLTFKSWSETMFQEEAQRALEPYRLGAMVTVLYDPQRPRRSVLERRPPRGLIAPCFVVVLLGGTSVMCLATGLRGLFEGP